MRRAFQWTYERLGVGKSRRSILLASKAEKRLASAVRDAFKLQDRLLKFDEKAFSEDHIVLGVDEVGRGPLAGPLVAACVQLPYPNKFHLPFLRDSKKLKTEEREYLAQQIKEQAAQWSIGVVEAKEFGHELNLHQLTFLAMDRALAGLKFRSENSYGLLVDGKFPLPSWSAEEQQAVIKGDDTSLSIAAASVLAKVYRDQKMLELHKEFPQYGFESHVGYGTEAHRKAIHEHGPCPEHRSNFLLKILNE